MKRRPSPSEKRNKPLSSMQIIEKIERSQVREDRLRAKRRELASEYGLRSSMPKKELRTLDKIDGQLKSIPIERARHMAQLQKLEPPQNRTSTNPIETSPRKKIYGAQLQKPEPPQKQEPKKSGWKKFTSLLKRG